MPSRFSVKTCYNVGIFTLQRGLDSSPPIASHFAPRCSASSITLQRDAQAHFLCRSPFLSLAWFWHKGFKLGHFGGSSRGVRFGGKKSMRGRPSLGVPSS